MAGVLAIVPAESKKNGDASLSVSRLTLLIKVIHAKSPSHPAACRLFGCPGAGDSVFGKCDLLIFVDYLFFFLERQIDCDADKY